MPCSLNGKNIFVAVLAFFVGVTSATWMSFAPPSQPPAPNIFQPPKAAPDKSCRWVSYEQWRKMTVIRVQLKAIEKALEDAMSDEARIGLLERMIDLQTKLLVLEQESAGDTYAERDGEVKLVLRQVCDDN